MYAYFAGHGCWRLEVLTYFAGFSGWGARLLVALSMASGTQLEDDEASDAIVEGSLYLCTGVGHDGRDQCRFVAVCSDAEVETDEGVFWHGEFIAASCPYWQHWMNNPGSAGCVAERFVFHACTDRECAIEYHDPEPEVVHIPWWRQIDDDKAMKIVVDWHARELEVEWPEWLFGAMPDELETR